MGAYDNPKMINDPRAAAAANVGMMIGNTLANIGKQYYAMRANQAKKVEKIEEFNQKTRNSIAINNENKVVKFGEKIREQNITTDMWESEMAYQRQLFDGIGEQGDKDYVMGATEANFLLLTNKNITRDEKKLYNEIKNKATDNISKVQGTVETVGSEVEVIKNYYENGNNNDNLVWRGFLDGDKIASQFTGQALISKPVPGVETSYKRDGSGHIFTHTVSKNNDLLKDMDLTSSDLDDIVITESGDNYIITQTVGQDFDILTPVAAETDGEKAGQDSGVLNKDNNIIAEIPFKFSQVNRIQTDDNGNRQDNTSIIGTTSSFFPQGFVEDQVSMIANSKASAISKQSNEQISAYLQKRHKVLIKNEYPDFFDLKKTTKQEQIDIIKSYEAQQIIQDIRGTDNNYKPRKITDSEIDQLYTAKDEGSPQLAYLPKKDSEEFKQWKQEMHYFKDAESKQGTYSAANFSDWELYDKKWILDPNYGKNNTEFYIPTADLQEGESNNISGAAIIQSNPDLTEKTRIVQTGKNAWILQKMFNVSGNIVYRDVPGSKPRSKEFFKSYLGLKTN